MTRPMPGPPEHRMDAHPHGDNGWCPICHHLTARRPYDPSKRLTDAEVAAEWDAAEQDASTASLCRSLGGKRLTTGQVEHFENAASTWHRFATHPHAFKETRNGRP